VHERRFSRTIVADEPDALAPPHGEVDTVKRVNGAEMLFGVAQLDDGRGRLGCHRRVP
jgi:hypothetical protein